MKNKRFIKNFIIFGLAVMLSLFGLFSFACNVEPKSFIVSFNANGGQLVSGDLVQKVSSSEEIVAPTFKKEGYTFKGFDVDYTLITEDTTINAIWEVNTYKIIFNANGGVLDVESLNVVYGSQVGELPIPKREGHVFTGWKIGSLEGLTLTQGLVFLETKDMQVYASYIEEVVEEQTYTITYNLDGGEFPEENPTSYKSSSEDITLISPQKQGYIFLGWKETNDAEPIIDRVIASGTEGNLSFTACWKQIVIEVNYNLSYQTSQGIIITSTFNGSEQVEPKLIGYGEKIGEVLFDFTPNIDNYERKAWVYKFGDKEIVLNALTIVNLENFPNAELKYDDNDSPYYSITITAKVFIGYVVRIQLYNFVYGEQYDVTFGGQQGPIMLIVNYGDCLGDRLKDAIISLRDIQEGIYFKNWYYIKDGQKVKVTSTTIFNEINFDQDEILLLPQLYSYWTPNQTKPN